MMRDWDDNGPWSKFIAEIAAHRARAVKVRTSDSTKKL
jgi:hypothetical protein